MPRPRTPSKLSDSLHRRLDSYALAASAAGVGMLALTNPADAKIVYTKAHQVIPEHMKYQLDLNHDKLVDFTITNSVTCATDECFYGLTQKPAVGNSAIGYVKGGYYLASALKRGARIGSAQIFFSRTGALVGINSAYPFSYVFGAWVDVQNRYLGFKFKIKGQTHYGWARLNAHIVRPPHTSITAILTGYAYETIPNKPIVAGKTHGKDVIALEPASLGHLARGASGLSAWRRTNSVAATH